ncbi:MAG: polyprenyl synthetase family protein [Nitrospinae bacterium]|nr:polyprenyl synthetase family protein [Nitrospinota bacterium]MBF0635438.1 polyprenyl synthetase family protein [Nitrospinota bacterium]
MPLTQYFTGIRTLADKTMDELTPSASVNPKLLHEAMRHSLFAGGKRFRPILAVTACEAVGGKREIVIPFAVAIEMIHTYTLIHDDLPAMDDDDFRRGVPTCHKKYGEAAAILAGDALLTLAFEILADTARFPGVKAETILRVARETAGAVGSTGTVGGQMVDIEMAGKEPDMATLEYIHTHKTGKLIVASIRGGAALAGAEEDQLSALTEYGRSIGLAFQIVDDLLDVEGSREKTGKTPGSDLKNKKLTYPSIMGVEESRKLAVKLTDRAIKSVEMFGESSSRLRDLAEYVIARAF